MTPPPTLPPAETAQDSAFSSKLSYLIEVGATLKDVDDAPVQKLSNIRYGKDSSRQSLDLYLPDELIALHGSPCDPQRPPLPPRPVFIHIHGGGWSRGSKDTPFYGTPAMSQNAAASGCIAVAPGYRLGLYPEFVHDCAAAIKWTCDNIADLGGDLENVFLSGHSAGGHIASLLVLRHSCFLAPLGIPPDFFRGLILVSGVYDLFSPMRKAPLDAKNKWFFLAYVMPAFGSDERLRMQASPLLLLEPNKDTSLLGKLAMSVSASFRGDVASEEAEEPKDVEVELNTSGLPNTLILNASFDMGLQENGELMTKAMAKYTDAKHVIIPGTDHASICWNDATAREVSEFIQAQCRC